MFVSFLLRFFFYLLCYINGICTKENRLRVGGGGGEGDDTFF